MQKNIHRRISQVALGAASILVGTQLALLGSANASISAGIFELDGDATDGAAAGIDWDEVFKAQTGDGAYDPEDCPAGASACAWENDGSPNATIFTGGGSKDPIDLPSWKWKDGAGGLPDKDNLLHSFAARFTEAGTSNDLLYFGSDRFDNAGDAHQAFWFFQNEVTLSDGKFVDSEGDPATHRDGDLLVISEFSNGGTVSTIVVYKWDSSVSGNLDLLASGTNARCNATSTQEFCGIVNPEDGTASPWTFLDKTGNDTFSQGEFFEGGINLSDPDIDLAGQCFASFASETRSSTSTTAVLKDFVLGGFGACESSLVTTPKAGDGTAIPSAGLSIGTGSVTAKDSAALNVSGSATWSGSLSFYLCGPIASPALCETGGVEIGSPIAVNQSTTQPVLSAAATLTSVGRYCWRGVFTSSTTGVPNSTDSSATECFTVAPVTPTLTTTAGADVDLGTAVTDTASLTGTATQPGTNGPNSTYPSINATNGAPAGGTITFALYGPGSANCNTQVGSSSTATVSGDNASYSATSVTPTQAGTYYWKAQYDGSSPNTNGTALHNANCDVSNEEVVVRPVPPTLTTAQSFIPNDSATIAVSAGGPPTGSVKFRLFSDEDCEGTVLYNETVPLPSTNVLSKTVSTGNTGTGTGSYTVTSPGATLYWLVEYTSTNANHTNTAQVCGKERSTLTIDNTFTPSP